MKRICITMILMSTFLALTSRAAETFPEFSEAYWVKEKELAIGKMQRGGGLMILGALTFVPAVILINKSVENPERYLTWSAVMSIAAIGMVGHGAGSLVFGKNQREQADDFIGQYRTSPASMDIEMERNAYIHDRKKTAAKVILFGSVLSLQGAMLVANGIFLSAKKSREESIGGATIWPSYLVGGILLAGGTAIIIGNAKRYRDLDALASLPVPVTRHSSISSFYYVDPTNGGQNFGLAGMLSF